MKKLLFILAVFLGLQINAQHTISGTFSPAKEYKWVIAYQLKPSSQNFVVDTAIKNGVFELKMPENAAAGTYRLVYAIPQEQFYFDVIYNGKEDITLAFDATSGVSFFNSKENILFNTYFKEITDLERQITDYYTSGNTDKKDFIALTKALQNVQDTYEKRSMGTMAHHFITSNKPYIPKDSPTVYSYIEGKKKHYFDALQFQDTLLQASGFLTDKLLNYTFTALPLKTMTDRERQEAMNANVNKINEILAHIGDPYKMHVFYSLWTQAATSAYDITSDYIYHTYLKKLAIATKNKKLIGEIEVHNRLRMGAVAPNIKWEKNKVPFTLQGLQGAENYILVFWSSTCSHCLNELPALHKKLEDFGSESVKVVAVGLENDSINWEKESARLPHFEHAIALGKWESAYAKIYDIQKTPTYFILDKDKRIIAKPETDKDVVVFLENK